MSEYQYYEFQALDRPLTIAAEAERAAAERQGQATEAERVVRARLAATTRRGDSVWATIELEIERRNASGYAYAAQLLGDLRVLAQDRGTSADFQRHLDSIRKRHARKPSFVKRLASL